MQTLLVSDLHMGKGDNSDDFSKEAEEAYIGFLKHFWHDQHAIVGDRLELWQASQDEIVSAHKVIFDLWNILPNPPIDIYGNHDIDIGIEFRILDINGVRMMLIHGHQWDAANKTGSGLGKIVTQVVGFLERRVHGDIDDWLSFLYGKVKKRASEYERGMTDLGKENCCGIVGYGHTHFPSVNNIDGVVIANCGCWTHRYEKGYPYILIDDNGTVKLQWWQP